MLSRRLQLVMVAMIGPLQPQAIAGQSFSAINHYQPVEPAYSKGSMGLSLGLQRSTIPDLDQQTLGLTSQDSNQTSKEAYTIAISKGTPWPLDWGASFTQVAASQISRAGLHLQYSFFQGFQLPSIAGRIHYVRTFGLEQAELSGFGLSLLTDYSFLRYFTVLAQAGWQHDQLQAGSNRGQLRASWQGQSTAKTTNFGYGLIVKIWPGILSLRYLQVIEDRLPRSLLQLSFGF